MNWPLKIQGRLITEAEVNEILTLLQNHPSWNRTRLSCELCVRWDWQRPDGQIKDMACRELLQKLEPRALIKLPPRQNYAPKRHPAEIKPIEIVDARNCAEHEKAFNFLIATTWMIFLRYSSNTYYRSILIRYQKLCFAPTAEWAFGPGLRNSSANWA